MPPTAGRYRVIIREGKKGVTNVPAFFINGEPFNGKPTFENLSKEIDAALKRRKRRKKHL